MHRDRRPGFSDGRDRVLVTTTLNTVAVSWGHLFHFLVQGTCTNRATFSKYNYYQYLLEQQPVDFSIVSVELSDNSLSAQTVALNHFNSTEHVI